MHNCSEANCSGAFAGVALTHYVKTKQKGASSCKLPAACYRVPYSSGPLRWTLQAAGS